MQMLDAETIHRLLPYETLIPALHKMHEGEMPSGDGIDVAPRKEVCGMESACSPGTSVSPPL